MAFPPTPLGADAGSQEIDIVNDGADPITLLQPAFGGADGAAFLVVTDTCAGTTLASSEACTVTVTFRPGRVGAHTATLQVPVEGEPDAAFESELSGEGIPWLRLTPSIIDFGAVARFPSAQREVLVENVSGRDISSLQIRTDPFPGPFRAYHPPVAEVCGRTLAAGATCRVDVTFRPTAGVSSEGRLVFRHFVVELGSVTLRGTGLPRPVVPPIKFPTPDATAVLRERLRAALKGLRGRSREVLLRRGLTVRGIVPPARGALSLEVRGRRASPRRRAASPAATLVAVRRQLGVRPGEPATIRGHLTRAGRRLLNSGRPLILDVKLSFVARSDDRLSEVRRMLRLGRGG